MSGLTRNLVSAEQAEFNRGRPGAYTFSAPIPADYDGTCFVVAALRLGDHAHLDVFSGRHVSRPDNAVEGERRVGRAGRLILRWHEWLVLRELLDSAPYIFIREVENPTRGNLDLHVGEPVAIEAACRDYGLTISETVDGRWSAWTDSGPFVSQTEDTLPDALAALLAELGAPVEWPSAERVREARLEVFEAASEMGGPLDGDTLSAVSDLAAREPFTALALIFPGLLTETEDSP